jgi:flagellar M-ring protein FliF
LPEFLKGNGPARFGVMVGVAAVLTAFFLYIAGVISEPPKTILFSGLDPRAAAQVTAKLDAMQVKYDAKGDGGTILVPADEVTKLRMELASENLPAAGTGYEIFDKTDSFGTSAFVQNINQLRALEGELARSIQTIDGIDSVRVHLVIPERQIFSREDQSPSASVIVKTEGRMNHGEVMAVQHLVAAAVAGLQPERVAIVDDQGTLLAGGDDQSGADAGAADEEQHTADLEDKLRQRVEGIVASVVGAGHVRVQVAADMNYDHTSTTSETFDPDSKVVRSTSTTEQNSSDTGSGNNGAVSVANALPNAQQGSGTDNTKSASGSTQETTNYEISKTTKTSVVDAGTVKRLSVAVVVDGDNKAAAAGKDTYTARTPQEMSQIEALVKSAIGYDKTRGDDVKVVNMEFAHLDVADATPAPAPLLGLDSAYWFKIIEAAILSLTALLIGLFVVRPLIARMFAPQVAGESTALFAAQQMAGQLPAPAGMQAQVAGGPMALPAPRESMIDISRIEGQVRESSIKKVGEVVGSHPEEALAIIRTWLHEPV